MRIDLCLDARLPREELLRLGLLAESQGIGAIWLASYVASRDPFANLVPLARESRSILLGPVAVNPYDTHPVRLATSLLTPKHFGPSIYNPDSYFIRSYIDPAVCWTGTTNGAWDIYTRKQYQPFEGWNSISQKTLSDNDPTNDLTPEAAQRLFLWEHRRQVEISTSDYDIDAGFGGPFPFISEYLGNLRFYASYRQSRNAYLIPLSRDSYDDYVGQLKVTSDIASNMKLTVEGLISRGEGTTDNNTGQDGVFRTTSSIANLLDRVSYIDGRIFSTDYWAPTVIKGNMVGAKLSHVLTPTTFYADAGC